jgi:hypothetical protein
MHTVGKYHKKINFKYHFISKNKFPFLKFLLRSIPKVSFLELYAVGSVVGHDRIGS